jgi:hypothetical protein
MLGFGYAGQNPALTKLAGPANAPVTTRLHQGVEVVLHPACQPFDGAPPACRQT